MGENPVDAPQPIAPAPKPGEAYTVLDFDPLEVARQLCLIDFRLLSCAKDRLSLIRHSHSFQRREAVRVPPHQLDQGQVAGHCERSACSNHPRSSLTRLANEFTNKLAYYMAYFIVSQPGVKEKSLAWQHTVKIAKVILSSCFLIALISYSAPSRAAKLQLSLVVLPCLAKPERAPCPGIFQEGHPEEAVQGLGGRRAPHDAAQQLPPLSQPRSPASAPLHPLLRYALNSFVVSVHRLQRCT